MKKITVFVLLLAGATVFGGTTYSWKTSGIYSADGICQAAEIAVTPERWPSTPYEAMERIHGDRKAGSYEGYTVKIAEGILGTGPGKIDCF